MEPKTLANMVPSGEEQRETQRVSSHQYYEAGMKALHESIEIKKATEAMIIEHTRTIDFLVMAIRWFGPPFAWLVIMQVVLVLMTVVAKPWSETAGLIAIGALIGIMGFSAGIRLAKRKRASSGRPTEN